MFGKFLQKVLSYLLITVLICNQIFTPAVVFAQEVSPQPTPSVSESPSPTQQPLDTPTPQPTDQPVPFDQPTSTASATITPVPSTTPEPTVSPSDVSESTSSAVETTLTPTPTTQPTPTTSTSQNNSQNSNVTPTLVSSVMPTPSVTPKAENNTVDQQVSAIILRGSDYPVVDLGAQSSVDSASLITNKPDYSPTDTALILGSGFKADTTYTIIITSNDPPAVHVQDQVTTDSSGSFVYSYKLDGNYRPNYQVEIKDSTSTVVATTTFTDSASTRTASVSGNWSNTATWSGAAVPTSSDDVTINSGVTVTVDTTASAASLTIDGTLAYTATKP